MGGALGTAGTLIGTAAGGPVGGVIGSALGNFAGTTASGGNFYDSLGSGVMGGFTGAVSNGLSPTSRIGDMGSLGGATKAISSAPSVLAQGLGNLGTQAPISYGLTDLLASSMVPEIKKTNPYRSPYKTALQESLGMPMEFWGIGA